MSIINQDTKHTVDYNKEKFMIMKSFLNKCNIPFEHLEQLNEQLIPRDVL